MKRNLLEKETSLFVLIDFQEKLANVMAARDSVEDRIRRLVEITGVLEIPLIVTEQYPIGLARTTPVLIESLSKHNRYRPVEKTYFSCFGEPSFEQVLEEYPGRQQLVLVGIETHVCVLQTAMEALERGYAVYVVADAVCSRSERDFDHALQRMKTAGITIVTFEMVAFEWLRMAGSPEFKAIHKLII